MANIDFTTFRGLADSKWSSLKGTFPKMVGLNIHDQPGLLTVNQKLAKDSGSTVDALPRVAVKVSTGRRYWFSYTSGKVFEDNAGTWSLAYTTVPGAGNAGCLGAAEYNGFLYWATQSRLHRIPISGLANWTANAVPNWQTFSVTDSSYHPMQVQNQTLFIGDGNQIASVNSSATFTANALNLIAPNVIKCLAPLDIDLIIGTIITNTVNSCMIVRWDTVQSTWQFAEPVRENGINAFLWVGTSLVAQAGTYGNFYYYDGQFLQPFKRLPGTWTPTRYGEVYPGAVGMLRGIALFGFSNSQDAANTTGDPADSGVYTIGRYSKDYPWVINGPEYVISQNDVTDVEIGAILVDNQDLYVSWNDGTNSGVDKLDYSNKYGSAYIEFPNIVADILDFLAFRQFVAAYSSLPASTSFTFKYKANNATSFTTIGSGLDDTSASVVQATESVDARTFQLRVEFNVSGNNSPDVEAFRIITQDVG